MKSGLKNEGKKTGWCDERIQTLNSDRFGSEVLFPYSLLV